MYLDVLTDLQAGHGQCGHEPRAPVPGVGEVGHDVGCVPGQEAVHAIRGLSEESHLRQTRKFLLLPDGI